MADIKNALSESLNNKALQLRNMGPSEIKETPNVRNCLLIAINCTFDVA
jgi:hypothetical protein